jgi:hypothetical protein
MIMRFLHLTVVATLIVAAAFVYKIKFESTMRAAEMERLAGEIRRERDAIAALRAEWALLGSPARIQGLVERHLALRMLDPAQIDHLDHLPERPVPPGPQPDAIAAMIDSWETDVEKRTDPTPTPPIAGGAR